MKRGAREASAPTMASARPAAVRWRSEPVYAAYVSRAFAAAVQPDGVALSVGSCGRRISSSASSAVSYRAPDDSSTKCASTVSSSTAARSSHSLSPVTANSARKPSAVSA